MTITRKRAMSVVLGSSVALSAAACPVANAAPRTPAAPTVAHRARGKPKRRAPKPMIAPRGGYVYEAKIGGEISTGKPNMVCSGASIKFSRVALFPEGNKTSALWEKTPAAWGQHFTITASATTTITVPWSSEAETREAEEGGGWIHNGRDLTGAAPASSVCGATAPNAEVGVFGEGEATWRLAAPVKSVAALLAQPPTSIALNELVSGLTILPNGAVPSFQPYS